MRWAMRARLPLRKFVSVFVMVASLIMVVALSFLAFSFLMISLPNDDSIHEVDTFIFLCKEGSTLASLRSLTWTPWVAIDPPHCRLIYIGDIRS